MVAFALHLHVTASGRCSIEIPSKKDYQKRATTRCHHWKNVAVGSVGDGFSQHRRCRHVLCRRQVLKRNEKAMRKWSFYGFKKEMDVSEFCFDALIARCIAPLCPFIEPLLYRPIEVVLASIARQQ